MKTHLPKLLAVTIFISTYTYVLAQPVHKIVETKIDKTTIFLKGAQIDRSGKTLIPIGNSELVFKNISPYINKESIQIKGEGNFTILSVVHKLNYLEEQNKQSDLSKLQAEREILQDKINTENDLLSIYNNEEILLEKNQAIVSSATGLKTIDLKEAADFHRQRLTEIKIKKTEINKRVKKLNEDFAKINKQENIINSQATTATSEIIVTVQSNQLVSGNFSLSYLVDKAGWYPTYDVRVKDISQPITLIHKANIYQASGEDWKNVKLTLSTANPKQSGQKPNLSTWQLRYFTPNAYSTNGAYNPNVLMVTGKVIETNGTALSGVTVQIKGASLATVTDANGNFSITVPQNATTLVFTTVGFASQQLLISSTQMNVVMAPSATNLNEVVVVGYSASGADYSERETYKKEAKQKSIPLTVAERENIASFSYDIETPYTILNDGKLTMVEMKAMEVPALYEYFCVPKLETDVFLTAKIIDWADLNLLEGESSIYFEGTYIGKSIINTATATDTLSISLGRDKNIQVKRLPIKEYSKKQLLGGNKIDYRTLEITVRNTKKQAIELIIEDQYPLSTIREVEVDRIEHKEATLDDETGKLKWMVKIEPSMEKKLQFKYSVKYPKGNNIILD
jgi:hypothetical protein